MFSRAIFAILVEGIMRNISVKLFWIWTSDSGGDGVWSYFNFPSGSLLQTVCLRIRPNLNPNCLRLTVNWKIFIKKKKQIWRWTDMPRRNYARLFSLKLRQSKSNNSCISKDSSVTQDILTKLLMHYRTTVIYILRISFMKFDQLLTWLRFRTE